MSDRIIVSRHPAAVEFIARSLAGRECSIVQHKDHIELYFAPDPEHVAQGMEVSYPRYGGVAAPGQLVESIPVVAEACPDDVRDKVVYGNLPLHLAALAAEVHAIEFSGKPPRGAEYSLDDMEAAGAKLVTYRVEAIQPKQSFSQRLGL